MPGYPHPECSGIAPFSSVVEEKKTNKKPELKPGNTNNPYGRPKGSKNVVSIEVKSRISDYVQNKFIDFEEDLDKIKDGPATHAKLFIELMKFIVPKPRDIEVVEQQWDDMKQLITRLFPTRNKEK